MHEKPLFEGAESKSSSAMSSYRSSSNPLMNWDESVKALTLLSASRDVKPAYTVLINLVAKAEFSNALYADPNLFIREYQENN